MPVCVKGKVRLGAHDVKGAILAGGGMGAGDGDDGREKERVYRVAKWVGHKLMMLDRDEPQFALFMLVMSRMRGIRKSGSK